MLATGVIYMDEEARAMRDDVRLDEDTARWNAKVIQDELDRGVIRRRLARHPEKVARHRERMAARNAAFARGDIPALFLDVNKAEGVEVTLGTPYFTH